MDSESKSESLWPRYLNLGRQQLRFKVETARRELAECRACPRNCGVDRLAGEMLVCGTGRHSIVSSSFPHFGEESCLRGWRGSGTIFFSLCNLHCVFCQNSDISQMQAGEECDEHRIADRMLELQDRGCHNINFVTPEHVAPQVVEAIAAAIPRGFRLPIVYNTSAYDALDSLRLLDGLIDIYMPDFKFWSVDSAKRLAKAKDYPQRAREAILEMHRQVGPLVLDERGLARQGLLVRHLVMPGQLDESEAIFRWLATELGEETFVNVMGQYRPAYQVAELARSGDSRYQEIARATSAAEVTEARRLARRAGLSRLGQG